jgi:hypothetical protein
VDIRVLLVDWTKERILKAVGLVLMLSFIFFAWINIGTGPTEEVEGMEGMGMGIKGSV